jgi:hypothetical protein
MSNRALLGIGAVIIALAVCAGAYLGWRMNMSSGIGVSPQSAAQGLPQDMQMLRHDAPLTVTLCYPVNGLLSIGSASIKRQPDTQAQAREALMALLTDQRASVVPGLKDIRIQELYLDASGTVYIDIVPQQKEIAAAAGEELLAVYAMVNTLMLNFEDIKQVLFLMEGREAKTLAGHVDLTRKFTKRTDLLRQ